MASTSQLTGMRGVYLVAAELSKLGFIASPTSRNATGADILVTDQSCQRSFSVQVKTNARVFNFWLLNKKVKEQVSDTHIYVFVNIRRTRKSGETVEFYVIPSKVVSEKIVYSESPRSEWYSLNLCNDQRHFEHLANSGIIVVWRLNTYIFPKPLTNSADFCLRRGKPQAM